MVLSRFWNLLKLYSKFLRFEEERGLKHIINICTIVNLKFKSYCNETFFEQL